MLIALNRDSPQVIFEAIDTNRKFLRQWLPFVDLTHDIVDTEKFVNTVLSTNNPKPDVVFEIRHQHEFCGLIAFKEIDNFNHKTEMGYWMIESKQGKGIMLRSCRALIEYAFNKLDINRIQVKCAVQNEKSMQIPKRLGFEYEGIEKQGELLNGKYTDLIVFSLLKTNHKPFNHSTNKP